MAYVEAKILVKGDKYEIYKLAKDMEKFSHFMRDVEEVKVRERFDNKTITEWRSLLDEDTPISWRELDEFDDKTPKIKYKLLEGDLDKFEGEWRFEEVEDGTQITLTVDYDFGMPAFENIVGPVLKVKVYENCMMMLSAIKDKIEKKIE